MSGRDQGSWNTTPKTGTASQGTGGVQEQATEVKEQVQQQAIAVKDQITAQATDKVEAQKTAASESLSTVAQAFRQTGQQLGDGDQAGLARYIDRAADQVEQFASYLGDRDMRGIARDAEAFARREPALFLGGAFAVGLLAARFLKSTGQASRSGLSSQGDWRGQGEWYGQPAPAGWTPPALPEASPYRTPGISSTPAGISSTPAAGRPSVPPPGTEVGGVVVGGPPIDDVIVGGPPRERDREARS
jgi:hypothetical protein